jgi:hypothetical protein
MGSAAIPDEKKRAIVYMRDVRWDVVVPLGLEWEFMQAFGQAFRRQDTMDGGSFIKAVDGYYEHGGGWHIQVSVNESEEVHLLEFCREFFGARGISFREPEAVVHSAAVAFLGLFHKQVELKMKDDGAFRGEVLKGMVIGVGPTCVTLTLEPEHPLHGRIVNVFFEDIADTTLEKKPSA